MYSAVDQPATPYPVFVTQALAAVGLIINFIHLIILYRLKFDSRNGGSRYRDFLYSIAASDIIMLIIRISCTNPRVQSLFTTNHLACALSALLGHTTFTAGFAVLTLGAADRLHALVSVHYHRHWHVRHFRKIILAIWMSSMVVYGTLGAIFYKKAFSPAEYGTCNTNSKELPLFIPTFYIGFLLFIAQSVLMVLIITKTRRVRSMPVSDRRKRLSNLLNRIIILLLITQWFFYTPTIITIILSRAGMQTSTVLWTVFFAFNPILNPMIYGCTMKSYRVEVRTLFRLQRWRSSQTEAVITVSTDSCATASNQRKHSTSTLPVYRQTTPDGHTSTIVSIRM